MRPFVRRLSFTLAASLAFSQTAAAFCGFYVATTDTPLINKASRVVLAHDGETTRVTMASDVYGDPKQFGLVVPVPTVIKKDQVKIINPAVVQHLVDYTKPRLVQYHDEDPCRPPVDLSRGVAMPSPTAAPVGAMARAKSTVRIEEQYAVGEYDITVITATKPADLVAYLNANGYRMPRGADETVGSYLRQGMHFFLAKINMARMKGNTTGFLRPIQVTYQSPKFMLPIRLGTVNADGAQDMIMLGLTRKGRVEAVNYRTVKMPTGQNVPLFVESRFGTFYDALFEKQVAQTSGSTFLEYAWGMGGMGFCDPCSAPPVDEAELIALGATWMKDQPGLGAFVTRLHIRYDRTDFPEDLVLRETADRQNFQARYVLNHPFTGDASCPAGVAYRNALPTRFAKEANTLRALTGWDQAMIKDQMEATGQSFP